MKSKLFFLGLASLLLVGCNNKSQETRIVGEMPGVDTVRIIVSETKIDTLVGLKDGKIDFTCPNSESALGVLFAGRDGAMFIPDGSTLTVSATEKDGKREIEFKSSNPKSDNYDVKEFESLVKPMLAEFDAMKKDWYENGGGQDSPEFQAVQDKYQEIISVVRKFIDEHLNSVATAYALQNFQPYEVEQLDSLSQFLGEKVLNNTFVKSELETIKGIQNTKEGMPFVDFTIPDSNGKEVKFSDYVGKGKYVVVDFWASWCGPCRQEIPYLIDLYNKYKGDNFDVLGVAVWDKPEDSIAAAEKMGINYSEIINAQEIPTVLYGIKGIPQIILFGPDGTILKRNLRGKYIAEEVAKYVQPSTK